MSASQTEKRPLLPSGCSNAPVERGVGRRGQRVLIVRFPRYEDTVDTSSPPAIRGQDLRVEHV